MDDLTITDQDDDAFQLGVTPSGYTELRMETATVVDLDVVAAERVVAWLQERFQLEGEQVADFKQSVTITVPGAAGGEDRHVDWMGDGDAPGWLQRLAEIALGQQDDWMTQAHEDRLSIIRSVSATLTEAGLNPEGDGIAACVSTLAKQANPGRWGGVLAALGAASPEIAAETAETWRTWIRGLEWILTNRGVVDTDLLKGLNELLARNAKYLAEQTQHWRDERQRLTAQASRDVDAAVAREREARADVQVRLNAAMAQLNGAISLQRQTESNLEDVKAGRTRQTDLVMRLEVQLKAMQQDRDAAVELQRQAEAKLAIARETLVGLKAEMLQHLNREGATAPGVGTTEGWFITIGKALEDSVPAS